MSVIQSRKTGRGTIFFTRMVNWHFLWKKILISKWRKIWKNDRKKLRGKYWFLYISCRQNLNLILFTFFKFIHHRKETTYVCLFQCSIGNLNFITKRGWRRKREKKLERFPQSGRFTSLHWAQLYVCVNLLKFSSVWPNCLCQLISLFGLEHVQFLLNWIWTSWEQRRHCAITFYWHV